MICVHRAAIFSLQGLYIVDDDDDDDDDEDEELHDAKINGASP